MFTQHINPTTGKMEWLHTKKDLSWEEEDLSSELARSQYGDMLHDTERNQLYLAGIRYAVESVRSQGLEPRVLDIGTGTGLLAMMAARAGAKHITACEVLKPMAKIASDVIADNHLQSVIKLIPKRSTDMTVGPDGDIPFRANILITEIFDSELIGEGVLPTLVHAHKHLIEPGAIVVPSGTTVFAQILESEFLRAAFYPDLFKFLHLPPLHLPQQWEGCPGPPFPWNLHLEQLSTAESQLKLLSNPLQVARFSFSDVSSLQTMCHGPVPIPITQTGTCHAVAVWWNLTLAPGVELSLSPWKRCQQWRDHWLQCVHYPPLPISAKPGEDLILTMSNDDYTSWLTLQPLTHCSLDTGGNHSPPLSLGTNRPMCHCGIHMAWSRSRLSMLSNSHRNELLWKAIKRVLISRTQVLFVSDGSMLPVLVALHRHIFPNLVTVYTVESNPHSARCVKQLLECNSLKDQVQVITKMATEVTSSDLNSPQLDALIAEPYFTSSLLPWHSLYFWYVRSALQDLLTPDAAIVPCRGFLRAIAVQFEHLHKLKECAGTVEDFDLSAYDRAVRSSSLLSSPLPSFEPDMFPLWEYPSYPLSSVETLLEVDFTSIISEDTILTANGRMEVVRSQDQSVVGVKQPCHGVVLWMDYQLLSAEEAVATDQHLLLTEGLTEAPQQGERLHWVTTHKQAVYFFSDYDCQTIPYQIEFAGRTGEIQLSFENQCCS